MSQLPLVLVGALTTALLVAATVTRLRAPPLPLGLRDGLLAMLLMVWVSAIVVGLGQQLSGAPDADPSLGLAVVGTAAGGLLASGFGLARVLRTGAQQRVGLVGAPLRAWLLALLLVPSFLVVSAGWSALLDAFGYPAQPQLIVSRILDDPTAPEALAALAYGVVVAPLVEEFLFRGLLLKPLAERVGAPLAIGATALLFGLLHLTDPAAVLPLIIFGVILALLRLRSGSLGPPVLLHAGNNLLAFVLAVGGVG